MIVLSVKIVVWLAVLFAFFDSFVYRWNLIQALIFLAYWCTALVTMWAFGRCESVLARQAIMGLGSFVMILGPFLMPYPVR